MRENRPPALTWYQILLNCLCCGLIDFGPRTPTFDDELPYVNRVNTTKTTKREKKQRESDVQRQRENQHRQQQQREDELCRKENYLKQLRKDLEEQLEQQQKKENELEQVRIQQNEQHEYNKGVLRQWQNELERQENHVKELFKTQHKREDLLREKEIKLEQERFEIEKLRLQQQYNGHQKGQQQQNETYLQEQLQHREKELRRVKGELNKHQQQKKDELWLREQHVQDRENKVYQKELKLGLQLPQIQVISGNNNSAPQVYASPTQPARNSTTTNVFDRQKSRGIYPVNTSPTEKHVYSSLPSQPQSNDLLKYPNNVSKNTRKTNKLFESYSLYEPQYAQELLISQSKSLPPQTTAFPNDSRKNYEMAAALNVPTSSHLTNQTVHHKWLPDTRFRKSDKIVLLLGETGVGKSTFVNSILNYLTWPTLEQANGYKAKILIPTRVDRYTEDYQELEPYFFPHNLEKHIVYHEEVKKGQSLTQEARHYIMEYGSDKRLVLIDTAGIGDTRGIEYDKKNLKQLKKYLLKEGIRKIHGICILLHPNYKHLTAGLKYTLHSTIDFFGPSSFDNIFFCFTRTAATSYKPGDTLSALRQFLHTNTRYSQTLTTTPRNVFCFENSCFREKLLLEISPGEQDEFTLERASESWNISAVNMMKLIRELETREKPFQIPEIWFTTTDLV